LQREPRFACLFISHEVAVVQNLSNRVAVLYASVFAAPRDPYTQRLLASALTVSV